MINSFHNLKNGEVSFSSDVQSYYAVEQGLASVFEPVCQSTVVIAVDRDQTSANPNSWASLPNLDLPVSILFSSNDLPFLLGAVSYGLEGEDYTLNSALSLFNTLNKNGLLLSKDPDAPILLCTDTDAFRLATKGRNLQVILPSEGTFSYTLGLLSRGPIPPYTPAQFLAKHFRLLDGRCGSPVCPSASEYEKASRVTDYEHFSSVTHDSLRDFRRNVLHIRLYTSADGRESILFIAFAIILTLLWMITALHRSIHSDLKKAVIFFSFLLIGWMMIRLYKYQCPYPQVDRICWYAFYFFIPGLPLFLLILSSLMGNQEEHRKFPGWIFPFLALYPVLIGLVFTNDLHQLVFRFNPGEDWSSDYTYGPGYFAIYLYCGITLLLALGLLIHRSRKSPGRFSFLLPIGLVLLIFAYTAGYVLNIPLARQSDLTLVICLFALLFFETIFRTGLIPTNTRYKSLFTSSPLKMQLLDREGNVRYAGNSALPLTQEQKSKLMWEENSCLSLSPDLLLYGKKIKGGTVIWENDRTDLNILQKQIQNSVRKLEAANLLLQKEESIRHQKRASEIKSKLFQTLEGETREQTEELSNMIRQLPTQKKKEPTLAHITLLLCHIKRRCNLFFLAQENLVLHGDELAFYLDELSEFAGYAKINALVRCGISENMDIRKAIFAYDFYFAVLSWDISGPGATLLGQLRKEGDTLIFHILCPASTETLAFSPSFLEEIKTVHGELRIQTTEDSSEISLLFTGKGDDSL